MLYPISLGSECSIARHYQKNGQRTLSMPLDWMVIPVDSSITLFATKFNDYLNEDNLVYCPPQFRKLFDDQDDHIVTTRTIITPVVDKKYKILYPHDFSVMGKEDLRHVQDKYRMRINRMYDLFEDPNNEFIFSAANVKPHQFQLDQYNAAGVHYSNNGFYDWKDRMNDVLKSLHPNLKYELI